MSALKKFKRIASDLLSDRAGALGDFPLAIVCERGSEDAHVINSIVIVKPIVLSRDHRLGEHFRQALIGNRLAVLNEEFSKFPPLSVIENRSGFHLSHLL